jgi:hypothetical protein
MTGDLLLQHSISLLDGGAASSARLPQILGDEQGGRLAVALPAGDVEPGLVAYLLALRTVSM